MASVFLLGLFENGDWPSVPRRRRHPHAPSFLISQPQVFFEGHPGISVAMLSFWKALTVIDLPNNLGKNM